MLEFNFHNIYSQSTYCLISIIFLTYITYHIFISTFRAKIVNRNVIHGAIVVYLLIGFIWSFIYSLIECLHPGSFTHMGEHLIFWHRPFVYFSFVTLTTLGFGDITPATPLTQSLVILEAISVRYISSFRFPGWSVFTLPIPVTRESRRSGKIFSPSSTGHGILYGKFPILKQFLRTVRKAP